MASLTLTYNLQPNTNENVGHVQQNFNDVRSWANGNVSDDNLAPTCSVYANYKLVHFADAVLGNDAAAGFYPLTRSANGSLAAASTAGLVSAGTVLRSLPIFYYSSSDRLVAGKTEKLRIRTQITTNATAPAINFTVALHPVTFAGGADALSASVGAVVAGSGVTVTAPVASDSTSGVGLDFPVPPDGAYCLAVQTSGTIANNAVALVNAQLQSRHV